MAEEDKVVDISALHIDAGEPSNLVSYQTRPEDDALEADSELNSEPESTGEKDK